MIAVPRDSGPSLLASLDQRRTLFDHNLLAIDGDLDLGGGSGGGGKRPPGGAVCE